MMKTNGETVWGTLGTQILEDTDALIYGIRYDTYELTAANGAVKRRFPGFRPGMCCYQLLHKRQQPCAHCPMDRVKNGECNVNISARLNRTDEWLQVIFNDVEAEDGEHICVCTASDITGVKESVRMTENVLNGINAAAYTIGADDYRILSANTYLQKLLPEIQKGDLCYQALWDRTAPCEHCPVPRLNRDHMMNSMEIYNSKLNLHLSLDSVRVTDGRGEPVVIFTGYDITRRVETEKRLKELAYTDVLLRINNRIAFMEDLTACFADGRRYHICMSRLKNFDNYNLAFGKEEGDRLLKDLAEYYTTAYPGRIYRVGGARFAYITDQDEDCDRLEKLLKKPIPEQAQNRHRNFRFYMDSVIIEIPRFAGTPEVLMHNAEYMLHKSGKMDSSEIMYFRSEEQKELERKNKIAGIVRRKIQEDGLEVYYQPIYSIQDREFSKCEALVRLFDEEFGFISPVEFIPIAEECGLINRLGTFVLDQACRLISHRKEQGLAPVQINVNVSTVQFSSEGFYDSVMDTINRYEIDRSLIHLEVTESILINSFDYIVELMKRLIDQGIMFAVDDFGTGYSSLSYIGTLPVVGIKLDKSFIDHIAKSEVYVLIVKNVMEIAKGLNFRIVAEGVESYGQYQILKKLGCDYIQGYLFSKPLPAGAFSRFLEEHYHMEDSEVTYRE